jgi:hypothetical protein
MDYVDEERFAVDKWGPEVSTRGKCRQKTSAARQNQRFHQQRLAQPAIYVMLSSWT